MSGPLPPFLSRAQLPGAERHSFQQQHALGQLARLPQHRPVRHRLQQRHLRHGVERSQPSDARWAGCGVAGRVGYAQVSVQGCLCPRRASASGCSSSWSTFAWTAYDAGLGSGRAPAPRPWTRAAQMTTAGAFSRGSRLCWACPSRGPRSTKRCLPACPAAHAGRGLTAVPWACAVSCVTVDARADRALHVHRHVGDADGLPVL